MIDIDVLDQLEHGVRQTGEVASALGIPEEDARQRLTRLVMSGHIAGPILVRWQEGDWHEIGFGLLPKGRQAVDSA